MSARPSPLVPFTLIALALSTMAALAVTRARAPMAASAPVPSRVVSPNEQRAEALARSGIEVALARLRTLATQQHWSWCAEGVGSASLDRADAPRPAQRWIYRARIGRSEADFVEVVGAGIPLAHGDYPPRFVPGGGLRVFAAPSFYRGNTGIAASVDPVLAAYPATEIAEYESRSAAIADAGRGRPVSGWLGDSWPGATSDVRPATGTYEERGDTYTLKVLDLASMVHVNVDSAMTEAFLDDLGQEVDAHFRWRTRRDGSVTAWRADELAQMGYRYAGLGLVGQVRLGQWLVARRQTRPMHVFAAKEEIHEELRRLYGAGPVTVDGQALAGADVASEDYQKLKDFITCHGHRERTVIEPGSLVTNQLYAAKDPTRPDREARAPININTASPPVIAAWLRGIAYHRYDDDALARGDATSVLVRLEDKLGVAALRQIAYRLQRLAYYMPLTDWPELKSLLSPSKPLQTSIGDRNPALHAALVASLEAAGLDAYDRDALQAMADPNTMLNKFNPDQPVRRLVDKYDLAEWSTELCFHSMGYYEIESRGLVTRDGGRPVAEHVLRGAYQIYDQIYVTTQRDFELGRLAIGRDSASNEDALLHDRGRSSVTTLPEPRGDSFAYAECGEGPTPYASADPRRYGRVALYDGCVSSSAAWRGALEQGHLFLDFDVRPVTSALDVSAGEGPRARRRLPGVDSVRDIDPSTGVPFSVARPDIAARRTPGGGRAALAPFLDGSDVLSLGLYADRLRARALAVPVGRSAGAQGGIQFWVKPRFARAQGRELWVCWRDVQGRAIRVYREGTQIAAAFDLGESSQGCLAVDTSFTATPWDAGNWHYVHVDWSTYGRLFVDGAAADLGGIPAELDTPARPALSAPHMPFGTSRYAAGDTLWVGGEPGTARSEPGFANATIDSLRVLATQPELPSDAGLVPGMDMDFRYHPRSYRAGVPMYWQDLTPRLAVYGKDVRLGTVRVTDWHDGLSFSRIYLQLGELDPQEAIGGA